MKKKLRLILSLALVMSMAFSFMAVTASAEGDPVEIATLSLDGGGTLTVKDGGIYDIDGGGDDPDWFIGSGTAIVSTGDLNIVLENTVPVTAKTLKVTGSLEVSGSGSLAFNTASGFAIDVSANITISSGELSGKANLNAGVSAKNITVRGGTLKGESSRGGIFISDGELKIENNASVIGISGGSSAAAVQGHGSSSITMTGNASLTAENNAGDAIRAFLTIHMSEGSSMIAYGTRGSISVLNQITVTDNASMVGVATQGIGIQANTANNGGGGKIVVSGNGTLEGTGTTVGVFARLSVLAADGGKITGVTSGYDGVSSNGSINATNGGEITGTGGENGVAAWGGNVEATDGGAITGTGSECGVYTEVNIEAANGGIINGFAPYYAVYAAGSVSADGTGSLVKGTADGRDDVDGSSAVMGISGVSASGGTVYEYYKGPVENVAPAGTSYVPYPFGLNMTSAANYGWSSNVRLSGDGLLANETNDDTRIIATRTGAVDGEVVALEAGGSHVIDMPASLEYTAPPSPTFPIIVPVTPEPEESEEPEEIPEEEVPLDPGDEIPEDEVPLSPDAPVNIGDDLSPTSPIPQTSDKLNLYIWLALFVLSAAGIAVTVLPFGKLKKVSK